MEQYIAIDNVCAWPNLTRLPNGDIVAVIFNQPTHGKWEGDVECWGSSNGGRIWEKRGTPAIHKPGTLRADVAVGLAGDGSLIVIVSGWKGRPPAPTRVGEEPKGENIDNNKALESLVCRSYDGGYTWSHGGGVQFHDMMKGEKFPIIPFGDIIQLSDGRLAASFYRHIMVDSVHQKYIKKQMRAVYMLYSEDDGWTWKDPSTIVKDDLWHNETDLICLENDRILAAARSDRKGVMDLFVSQDAGKTWDQRPPVAHGGGAPGHLLKLHDGSVLLTFGLRNKGFHGVGARISKDEGENWEAPIYLVDFNGYYDGTYPSSVQIEDGSIVTAYYRKHAPCHNRYHMGILIWKPEEFDMKVEYHN